MNASKPSLGPVQLNVIVLEMENAAANFSQRKDAGIALHANEREIAPMPTL